MSEGTRQILQSALDALQERAATLETVIDTKQRELAVAKLEAVAVKRAIKAQRKAIEEATRTRIGRSGSNPRERYPAEGTQTRAVLDAINSLGDHQITLGVLVTRTHLPVASVRTIAGRLVDRGYVERIGEGAYRRLDKTAA